ncbi:unnamed protein product [Rhizoctonia solani]|uniref:F-box domain-containing protein n=1 Tax=Rhizoctonia solani TaxID=456999 RepID=A0A8H3H240_9AGAM|nr:unnamed protein product [Rhizoctonia solani]
MPQELTVAGEQLSSALDRYAQVCRITRDACINGGQLNNNPDLVRSLEKEASDISSYFQRLGDARGAVQMARSTIPQIIPACALPTEILTHIFQLVLPDCLVQRGYFGEISKIKYPMYPDALAHVCSSWRQVAINSPSIWTHIDIALDHPLNRGLFSRAKAYVARAGQLPLEIHISDPGSEREKNHSNAQDSVLGPSHEWEDLHEFKILAFNAVPIKTLQVDLSVSGRYREIYYSVLEYFFARCKPGLLTKYIARTNSAWIDSPFIEPAETPHSQDSELLAVPTHHLGKLWLRISSVRLNCFCPHWESKLYHGLVELYIDQGVPEMSESQLVNILRSSTQLRVLHFNIPLDEISEDENFDPIYLEDLQELSLMIRDDGQEESTSRILQRITSGSKPLQMSLVDTPGEVDDFCSRANVTRLYVWCPGTISSILVQCRRLEILVLNGRDSEFRDLNSILYEASDEGATSTRQTTLSHATQIHTLYLLWHSQLVFEQIQAAVKKYSIQKLLIYYAKLSYETDEGRMVSDNTRNIRAKLSTITACPTIEYYPSDFPERYTENEPNDPDGWIRKSVRS